MGYLSLAILLAISVWILNKSDFGTGLSKKALWSGWAVKLTIGILFVLIFTYYYGEGQIYGDAQNFFNDSKILSEYAKHDFWGYLKLLFGFGSNNAELLQTHLAETQIWSYGDNGDLINDNRLILKINSLIHFISFNNIYVHVLILSFLSYIGILLLYRTFRHFVSNRLLFFSFIVGFPSIAFWGSGLTKEAIMIFGLGLFVFNMFKMVKAKATVSGVILLLISIAILLLNKPYMGLVVVPLSFILISGKWLNWNPKLLLIWPFIIISVGVILSFTPSQINLVDKTSDKQRDLINMGKGGVFFITDSSFCAFDFHYLRHFQKVEDDSIKVLKETRGEYKLFGQSEFHPFSINASEKNYALYLIMRPSNSYVDVKPIGYSGKQLVKNIPESLFNSTIRPFPTDPGSNLKHFVFVQNLFLLGWILFALYKRKVLNDEEKYLTFYLFASALIVLLLIGWTTPILGAVVRYKAGAELFIIIATFVLLKPLKISTK